MVYGTAPFLVTLNDP